MTSITLTHPAAVNLAVPTTLDDAFIAGLSIPQQIAIAMCALETHGFCQDVAGQVIVRDTEPGRYWTNPWGYTWDCVRASDMLLIDERASVLAGNPALRPSPSLELHFGILRMRPDVGMTLHNHPVLATAWSATQRAIEPVDQTSAIFFERQAWCAEFEDVEHLYDPAFFGRTGEALGPDAHLLWLAHHGVIVAHRDVAFATAYALYLERGVELTMRLGDMHAQPLAAPVARKMRDMLQTAFVIPDIWKSIVRSTLRRRPDILA